MDARAQPDHRAQIVKQVERTFSNVMDALKSKRVAIAVRAPPGSGKTHLLLRISSALRRKKQRVLVAAQTNSQADDICRRLKMEEKVSSYRFVRRGDRRDLDGVPQLESFEELPHGSCIVVGTSSKWGFISTIDALFDVALVDEAWQMQWLQFVPLGRLVGRFAMIGDPGQIPPVVAADASRWETAQMPPHLPAPEVIFSESGILKGARSHTLQLPASRRLPPDTVSLLQPFYDFAFAAWALPGDRAVLMPGPAAEPIDRAINMLADRSVVAVTCRTEDDLPPSDMDEHVAKLAVRVAYRLIERRARVRILDAQSRDVELMARHIGISATHRMMNELIARQLRRSPKLAEIRVDTPERWQGLQRQVMIAVHPLSGVLRPTSFDLETGRLCVMASRHQCGLIIIGRDHIGDTLDGLIVAADQPIGRPDVAGRGHYQHMTFWQSLEISRGIVRL